MRRLNSFIREVSWVMNLSPECFFFFFFFFFPLWVPFVFEKRTITFCILTWSAYSYIYFWQVGLIVLPMLVMLPWKLLEIRHCGWEACIHFVIVRVCWNNLLSLHHLCWLMGTWLNCYGSFINTNGTYIFTCANYLWAWVIQFRLCGPIVDLSIYVCGTLWTMYVQTIMYCGPLDFNWPHGYCICYYTK